MILQYTNPDYKQNKKILYLFVAAIAVVFIALLIILMVKPSAECGNGICESTENCYDCSKDCKCTGDQYCSQKTKSCVNPVCGNSVCEIGETIENCCDDCGCVLEQETCNKQKHTCEIPEASISNQRVSELVRNYFENTGATVNSVKVGDSTYVNGKSAKSFFVNISGQPFLSQGAVTIDEQVIVFNRY